MKANSNMEATNSTKDRFLNFLRERESARLRKEKGLPKPYSPDPILANYRFCNINREHDAVTCIIHEKFRVPFASDNRLLQQLLYARVFNEPGVFASVGSFSSRRETESALRGVAERGGKVFRGAYMMPGRGGSAISYWLDAVEAAGKLNARDYTHLAHVAANLLEIKGVGDFIANQVCSDLRYVPAASYEDWGTFVLCGPGTKRGLNRLLGREVEKNWKSPDASAELLKVREGLGQLPGCAVCGYFKDPNNLANALCEFDKYERACKQAERGERITLRHYKNTEGTKPL
jgi:hypothetical protein